MYASVPPSGCICSKVNGAFIPAGAVSELK